MMSEFTVGRLDGSTWDALAEPVERKPPRQAPGEQTAMNVSP